jgi:hypothetical protein
MTVHRPGKKIIPFSREISATPSMFAGGGATNRCDKQG